MSPPFVHPWQETGQPIHAPLSPLTYISGSHWASGNVGYLFWLFQLGDGATGMESVTSWDAANHPPVPRTAPTMKKSPTPNVNRVEVKKL